ncbi:MAG: hypothetical protein D3910_03325 [Candidatus Electrothrix sp. ATG2]|nr:hypothetical protein [Candidatus Electrothrix sp. ATG2]
MTVGQLRYAAPQWAGLYAVFFLQEATFLISGPPMMVKEMEEQLALLGVSSSRIRVEHFLGYT